MYIGVFITSFFFFFYDDKKLLKHFELIAMIVNDKEQDETDQEFGENEYESIATVAVSSLVFPDLYPFLRPCQSCEVCTILFIST